MTINSDRYLQFLLGSCIALSIWLIGVSFFYIEFEYLWLVILITALLILSIIVLLLLYLMELLDPHENDILMDYFFPPSTQNEFSIRKYILLAGLAYLLGEIYSLVKSHINFQMNKHIGMEFLGGKRKGSTHRKK